MAKYVSQPDARIVKDSIHNGNRVTTAVVTLHRYVLAELNTHRAFSRNSASSRAIPGRLQRQRVLDTPAVPSEWPQTAAGMQGGPDLPPEIQTACAELWSDAATSAVQTAQELESLGVHKSVTNRLLEPFLFQTVVITGDEEAYANFFLQRASSLAQPEIRIPAELLLDAYSESKPKELKQGQYHRPLVDTDEIVEYVRNNDSELLETTDSVNKNGVLFERVDATALANAVSAARCARVSYLTHEGIRDISKDLDLYNRLVSADPPHWSPLEHVCRPHDGIEPTRGNIQGWTQLRHIVERQR